MRQLFLVSSLLLGLAGAGQDSATPEKVRGRWRIGVSGSLDYCYRTMRNTSNDRNAQLLIDLLEKNEEPRFGWDAGVDVAWLSMRHWSLRSGIHVSRRGYRSVVLAQWVSVDPVSGDNSIPLTSQYHHQCTYVELPLLVEYIFGRSAFRGFGAAGLRLGYLVAAQELVENEFADRTEKISHDLRDRFRDFSLSGVAVIGAAYRFRERVHLRLAAEARYGITSITDGTVKKHLWSIGPLLGATYTL